jgi:hypothetical protein
MKLLVLTCAVFPTDEEANRKLWIFNRSVEKFNISPVFQYGVGRIFPSYRIMKLDWQLDYLRIISSRESYTHVLYTDSWDAFFCAPLSEIIAKYEAMGSPPILASAYSGFADSTAPAGFGDESIRLRFPNVGGYIAEIPAIIEAFTRMMPIPSGDDSMVWRDAWLQGWFRPALDSECAIFQVTDENCATNPFHRPHAVSLVNLETDSYPCILHLSGGYSSQESGKDDRMIPWARRLGIIA